MLLLPGNVEKTIYVLTADATNKNMAAYFVETAELPCLYRTLFWQRYVTLRRWIWILPYSDVSENFLCPSSGNNLARPPRFVHLALAFSQLYLFVCPCVCIVVLPRGRWTLVNFCGTAWRHTPESYVQRGIRLRVGTCLLEMTLTHDWMMTLVRLEHASM